MKFNWFEGTVPRSGFKVYHLKAEVKADKLGKFTEPEFIFSEVYSSRKKAEAAGRKFLKQTLKNVYKRYYKEFNTYAEFFEDCTRNLGTYDGIGKSVSADFEIMEFDPLFRENFEEYEKEYHDFQPADGKSKGHMYAKEIQYLYNIFGNMTGCWIDGQFHFPEDNLPAAGTRFEIGDFVTSNVDDYKQVYVVSGTSGGEWMKANKGLNPFWENILFVDYIDRNGNYIWDYGIFSESQFRKYEGEVSEELMTISKILKDEIKISKELWNRMETGKVDMSGCPSLNEAIANDKINSPEENRTYGEKR